MKNHHTDQTVRNNLSGNENKLKEIEKLVSGKERTEKIVSVEIQNDKAILFIEKNGRLTQEIRPNRFWILSTKQNPGSHKLQGNLSYKWGKQYSTEKEWRYAINRASKGREEIYTAYDPKEQLLIKDGITYFKGMKHTEPSILSFDIESTGLFHNENSKVLLISNTFRKQGKITRRLFSYDDYDSPASMLTDWCTWIRELDPSIICGHNIYSFDFKYLNYIAEQEGIELKLGRDGSALKINPRPSKFRIDGSRDQEYHKCRVYGRELIDTMFLAIRHDVAAKKYESYGLKSIIKAEGLERKDRVHYDSSTIRFNYTDPIEWKKIKEYCIHDSDDSLTLFDLTAPATFYLTQSVPKPFQNMVESATGSQINSMMIRSYLQDGHSIPKPDPKVPYEGAISFGIPGIYNNIMKIDIKGMYPSIIREYKYYNKEKDPNGNFLKLVEYFATTREQYKDLYKKTNDPYYDSLQNAMKIVANSFYGFLGAPGLHFNDSKGAAFVTETGRDILKYTIEWATSKDVKYWKDIFDQY